MSMFRVVEGEDGSLLVYDKVSFFRHSPFHVVPPPKDWTPRPKSRPDLLQQETGRQQEELDENEKEKQDTVSTAPMKTISEINTRHIYNKKCNVSHKDEDGDKEPQFPYRGDIKIEVKSNKSFEMTRDEGLVDKTLVNIPHTSKSTKNFSSTIKCKGCSQLFPCNYAGISVIKAFPSPEYFYHCIQSCGKYRALGIISECQKCGNLFISRRAMLSHKVACSTSRSKSTNKKNLR